MIKCIEFIKETNTFLIHDYDKETFFNFKSEVHKIDSFDTQFLDDVNIMILKLNNSSTDFIIQYISHKLANYMGFKSTDFMARECGKIMPELNKHIIPILKETYLNKNSTSLNFHFLKDNIITTLFKLSVVYKNKYLAVYVKNLEDNILINKDVLRLGKPFLEDNNLSDIMHNNELERVYDTLKDAEKTNKFTIYYKNYDGSYYYWTPGIYDIIERDPLPEDRYNHILLDLAKPEVKEKFLKVFDSLEANELSDNYKFKIITSKGNTKYLIINAKKVFDDNGNFIQGSCYTRDITDDVKREYKIKRLNIALNDAEISNKFTIYYRNHDGSYYWTSGIYDIIERDPLPGDKYRHVLLDLAEHGVKEEFFNVFDSLEPNELSDNFEFKIKTVKGNIKYLLFNFKKVFDDDGNYIQGSSYVKDITDDVKREHELKRVYDTLTDVEETNKFTIYYRNHDGSYYWTPGIYDIIERDPLPGDKYRHVLLDLAEHGVKEEFFNVFDSLEPNELSDNFEFKIKTVKGNIKYLLFNFKKVFDDNGNFIQGSTYVKDITDEYYTNRKITILNKLISHVNKQLGTGTFVYDYEINKLQLTDESLKILNIDKKDSRLQLNEINSNFIKQEEYSKKFKKLLNGEIKEIDGILEYKSPKRDYIQNLKITKMFFMVNNKPVLIGGIIDVTSEIKRQEELKKLNNEMDILIRESNHRIKNNLNLLLRFISIESRFNKNNPEETIENTIGRIKSLSLFHEKLYKSDNLKILKLNTYLTTFMEDIYNIYSDTYSGIEMICEDFYDFKIEKNNIIPISLILNELIINSLKYAYDDYDIMDKKISINVTRIDNNLELHYMDNGKGLPRDFNPEKSMGLGWTIIRLLVGQIDSEYKVYNDNGMNFKLTLPYLND